MTKKWDGKGFLLIYHLIIHFITENFHLLQDNCGSITTNAINIMIID